MNSTIYLLPPLLSLTAILLLFPTLSSSQDCQSSCGSIPIHYPFGTGPGCGSPAFQSHVTCDDHSNLIFTTRTGTYSIESIDYTNQILYIQDPSMSTCSCTNPSSGFSLDWDAPFSFVDGNIFALLDCSTSSSPLYTTNTSLCDNSNAPICSILYSCPTISQLDMPVSTCCIYTPVSLGPAFEMDLKKLQCGSYAGIYSFNGQENNPDGWKFGMALQYKFSVDDGYPSSCADCEKSNGVCGFTGQYEAFTCNYPNGMNTATNCYCPSIWWSHGSSAVPSWIGFGLVFCWWAIAWILL